MPLPITPYADNGPLYGLVWPSLISLSVTPGSYLFWARTRDGASAKAAPVATGARRLILDMAIPPGRPVSRGRGRSLAAWCGQEKGGRRRLGRHRARASGGVKGRP